MKSRILDGELFDRHFHNAVGSPSLVCLEFQIVPDILVGPETGLESHRRYGRGAPQLYGYQIAGSSLLRMLERL